METPKCVLHIGTTKSSEKIIIFKEQTLQKCYEKKSIREKQQTKSKFSEIVLPKESDGFVGYHPTCYRYYCSVNSKKKADKSNGNTTIFKLQILITKICHVFVH